MPFYATISPVFKKKQFLMRVTASPPRSLNALLLILTITLSACGGGTNTAGAGGSGIGGTGITTVHGNVSQVLTDTSRVRDRTFTQRVFAVLTDWLSTPANAQSMLLEGIEVIGGGQITTTDGNGNFALENVAPSDNFALTFVLEDEQMIVLPIGVVPSGSHVQVIDVVLDANQGVATAADVEIKKNEDSGNVQGMNLPNNNANGAGNARNGNNAGNSDNPGNGGNPLNGDNPVNGGNASHGNPPDNAGQNIPTGVPVHD